MKMLRERKYLFALLGLLLVFAACKGESPTAPPVGGGGGTTTGGSTPGGSTPETGTVITLTVSNSSPVAGSTSTVTASITQNGQPVPNGTAVEFATNFGTFTDTQALQFTIRTTTSGVATATVSSSSAGVATVVATINNVSRSATITFRAQETTPIPPPTAPTITAINPNFGLPSGGQQVTITGTNFRQPLRVLFDFGANTSPVEATIISATSTSITVITPRVDLGTGQTKAATIVVITDSGSSNEQRATSSPFTYAAEQLTPTVTILSPSNGPISGGTRVTIFGDAFQAPVSVQFGDIASNSWQDAQVINVQFKQIIAITPDGRATSGNGGSTVTGPVDLRITNINSGKSVTLDNAFRYTPKMQITAIKPNTGSALGGTDITIDGVGFDDPLTVGIGVPTTTIPGGFVLAQVLRVSGTQILARTGRLDSPCSLLVGTVVVTNVENGDSAAGNTFTYVPVPPTITGVAANSNPLLPGGTVTVTVLNPGIGPLGTANIRFSLGGRNTTATPNPISVGTGSQSFTVVVPTGLTFPSVSCLTSGGLPGTQSGPASFEVTFTNLTTGCTDTLSSAVTVTPPGPNPCVGPPVALVGPPSPACPAGPLVVAAGAASAPITINVANTASAGSAALTVSGSIVAGNVDFTAIAPSGQATVAPGQSQNFTVTFNPSTTGPLTGTVRFTTNDPLNPTVDVVVCGTGTP